jgi:GT2 family glycosyltransferase
MGAVLACVVLSFRNEPGLVAAVQSILAQEEPLVEVVVVNSGGRDPTETLRKAGIDVPVIHREERLYAGGARNLGIGATRAPYVAFLAGDCVAMPGWVLGRLRSHRTGALAVASAMVNAYPRNDFAWASYILHYTYRMPGIPPDMAGLYSVSYARELFDRFGRFREDLRAGEDTEFNARIAEAVRIEWAPHICTAHRHPTSLQWLLRDQYVRGRRKVHVDEELEGRDSPAHVAWLTLRISAETLRDAWRWCDPGWRPRLLGTSPLVMLAAAAFALGALLSDWKKPRDS